MVAEAIGAVLARGDWCTLALPAGHFNATLYERLAAYSLDWARVEFFFSEERCVPPGHPASSYGEADDRLFTNPRIGHHQVHRIEADRPDREAAAERYAEELPEAFDVLLVEPGPDGSLGALLPDSVAFDGPGAVHVIEGPLTPRYRMTVGPQLFASAAVKVVVACGAERAASVRAAREQEGPVRELPARLVRDGVWIVDRAAARQLAGRHA